MGEASLGAYVVFAGLAGLVVGGGLGVVLLRNVFHAAIAMVVSFLGVAGIFFSLQADFLAVVQVLIYIGAVAVIIALAIMLTRRTEMPETNRFVGGVQLAIGALLAAGLGLVLVGVGYRIAWPVSNQGLASETTRVMGEMLLTRAVLPFEIAGVLLLVAIIGAVLIAREEVRKS